MPVTPGYATRGRHEGASDDNYRGCTKNRCKSGVPKLRKQSELYPSTARVDLSGPVHAQTFYRCSADRRATDHFRAFSLDSKVQLPCIAAWMKQDNLDLIFFIMAGFEV